MFKCMKEFILPLCRWSPSSLRSKPTLTVSFQKIKEPEDTFHDEKTLHNNDNISNDCKAENQQGGPLNVFVESILSPLKELIPGIERPEHLSNLADFRIQEETLYDSQVMYDDDVDLKSMCYEQPRPLFHTEPVHENLSEQVDPELKRENELNEQMNKILCNMFKERESKLKELDRKKRRETGRDVIDMDTIIEMENKRRSEMTTYFSAEPTPSTATEQSNKKLEDRQKMEMNKILNQMMTTRRLRIKEYEHKKRQETARRKINIDTVVKNEDKQRRENNINDDSNPSPKLEGYDWRKWQPSSTDKIDISTIIQLENRNRSMFYRTEPTPQAKTITSSWEAQERLKKFIVSSKIDNIPKDLTTSNLSLKDYGGKEFKRSLNPMKTHEKDIDESKTKQSGSRKKTGEDA